MQANGDRPWLVDGEAADSARVSVVIPAYNAGAYLRMTLESVFAQTALPGEVIVVDDGSTDDTAAVARSCGATVISVKNNGGSAARNVGVQAARGEYIAFLDADDLWTPEKLAVQFAALTSHPQPAFSFTDFHVFDALGVRAVRSELRAHPAFRRTVGRPRDGARVLVAANDKRPVLPDMYFLPSSALVRRADVLAVGGFDESLRGCEDYEFFLRLFARVPAICVMLPLLLYRRHPNQVTASPIGVSKNELKVQQRVAAARDRYPGADAEYYLRKGFILHYRIGVNEARLGMFDEAVGSLEKSLADRRTLRAAAALFAARRARGPVGRVVFEAVRALRRKLRAQRRVAAVKS